MPGQNNTNTMSVQAFIKYFPWKNFNSKSGLPSTRNSSEFNSCSQWLKWSELLTAWIKVLPTILQSISKGSLSCLSSHFHANSESKCVVRQYWAREIIVTTKELLIARIILITQVLSSQSVINTKISINFLEFDKLMHGNKNKLGQC